MGSFLCYARLPIFLLLLLRVAEPSPTLNGPNGTEGYYWSKRGGTHIGNGAVPYELNIDWSRAPSWTWSNDEDELVRHGPVIDDKKNIYAATAHGWIRKFSPDGKVLWSWRTSVEEGPIQTSPFLYNGKLFITSAGIWQIPGLVPFIYAFDMETGKQLLKVPIPHVPQKGRVNSDSYTIHVAEGILLGPMVDNVRPAAGNNRIYGVNATDGSHLWDYVLENGGMTWNFMPSTPGDGTFYFSSNCGVAQRRRLVDGSLIWKSELKEPGHMCSTGGGALGGNGIFYAEANHFSYGLDMELPLPGVALCTGIGSERSCAEGSGIMVAHRAEDGKVLWARRLGYHFGGAQYPAVAKIGGRWVLVAGVGHNPGCPQLFMGQPFLPGIVRYALARLQTKWAALRRWLGVPVVHNAVVAYDGETGEMLWQFEEEPWSYAAAAGDEDLLPSRMQRQATDPRLESICWPDPWGIPAVVADGTVVIGSGNNGNLYAIRDVNGDGHIQPEEVSTLQTGMAFLNGPALAPGMLVAAPCWGKMYVYRSGTR